MPTETNKFFLKLFSLFSVVRGYNLLVLALAIYFASIFIMAHDIAVKDVLLDLNLHLLVLSSLLAIASGYIINNFYDSEKDLINRPAKTLLDNYVSQNTKLGVYFGLNFLSVIVASYVSFKAVLFFSGYIFLLWIYSHKLKRKVGIATLMASMLAVLPFFIVFVYYKNLDLVIFVHALYLFLLVSIRELIKDLENLRGDFVQEYKTLPVVYGMRLTKKIISVLCVSLIVPALVLISLFDIGYMTYYFGSSVLFFIFFILKLWQSRSKKHYVLLHNLLKLVIVIGIFSIVLIDLQQVVDRIF
ncbi:geranylgeranylglycerol-phosphate geranylgeranyltransferase [Psychroflexus sp. ALD_RP9]|uniref:geranylgeranylglycerol-phosphate geranylgeranyltransferase n=1 Tax=Psychroflexus sp. ALD_RP9 TaxID=2777186 RepID=UPI001A8EF406|nr:geranylgeranylglycerol-phosphate geranylgeranyltransferase [Psychroflexus sp. ALD_RP9]QSS97829.1 geranylgeranylglycerol-phosphate geranylgeranyltransferase [Psychroflexus sp. ALD_RP9]